MVGFEKYRIEVFRDVFVEQPLPAKDMLSINRVAATLGISVRTLRRLIRQGSFPKSNIHRGTTAYWQRQDVREWQMLALRGPEYKLPRRGTYRTLDYIDQEKERDFARKPLDEQALYRGLLNMEELLERDPDEFIRQHPNLKEWLRERALRRKQGLLRKPPASS